MTVKKQTTTELVTVCPNLRKDKHRGPWYFRGELLLKENARMRYSDFTT